jgi:alpha-N-acetylglucosaminidase
VVPAHAAQFVVESIPADAGRDVFELEAQQGKIVLRGNNGVSIASALNRYLVDYAHAHVSWGCGDQLALPDPSPPVPAKLRVTSPHAYRFAYNYCTHGYTMAWWDWPRWERELDYLAMQGTNLALIVQGQEQVWIETLGTFGYTAAEVRQWLCMPTHQPWQYMSNLQGYGGPVPASLVARRVELGQRILGRMRELGQKPVLQGYYGIVPPDFSKRVPGAKVHPQGDWSALQRPDLLEPTDPVFARFARSFYAAQAKLFGRADYFAADPFHEGGSAAGIDIQACGRAIFGTMQEAAPGSVWVVQSWQHNPRAPMLEALPKAQVLLLDLCCENRENWRRREQFRHRPFLWCTIHNFGGNSGLGAKLSSVAEGPARALDEAGPGKGQLKGIGALAEGSGTNPMLWDLFFANAWHSEAVNLQGWVAAYARRRYGAESSAALEALHIVMRTAYAVAGGYRELPHNSAVCARPSLDPEQRARQYTPTQPGYDPTELAPAWGRLLDAADACSGSDGYCYDVADVGRQVLADLGTRYHQALCAAWARRDAAAVSKYAGRLLGLIRGLDELAATRAEWLLGVWLANARAWGTTAQEQALCERAARTLLTTWTVPESHGDYANRQWAGLLGDFYLRRWTMWLDAVKRAMSSHWRLNVEGVRKQIQDWEYAWTRERNVFAAEPRGDTLRVARRLWEKYRADAADPELGRP